MNRIRDECYSAWPHDELRFALGIKPDDMPASVDQAVTRRNPTNSVAWPVDQGYCGVRGFDEPQVLTGKSQVKGTRAG